MLRNIRAPYKSIEKIVRHRAEHLLKEVQLRTIVSKQEYSLIKKEQKISVARFFVVIRLFCRKQLWIIGIIMQCLYTVQLNNRTSA